MINSKTQKVIEIIAALFILLFTYTSLSKFTALKNFEYTLGRSPLIHSWAASLSWILPASELAVVVLLIIPAFRLIGLYLSFALMTLFTVYIAFMLLSSSDLPCSCGGIIRQLSWNQHLVLNIVLTILAAFATYLEYRLNYSWKKMVRT